MQTSENLPLPISAAAVYGIHRKVHLWPHVNQAILWINRAKRRKRPHFV
jgi:hypothetical protein